MTRARVLVVDDKASFLTLFEKLIDGRADVLTASSASRALGMLAVESFDLVITDIRMPGMDGQALLREIKQRAPEIEVILVTAYGTIPQAVEAMQHGAFSYVTKPFEPDEAWATIEAAIRRKQAQDRARASSHVPVQILSASFRSVAMQRVFEVVRAAAQSPTPVWLLGEPGCGRRTVARWIHDESGAAGPFTATDPARLRTTTGGFSGTLYVSNAEQLDVAQQRWLAAALAEPGPLRLIVSAEEPPERLVADGILEQTLAQQLCQLPIQIPPLRERQADIPVLVRTFLERASSGASTPVGLTAEALAALVAYDWPGNVGELQSVIHGMAVQHPGRIIGLDAVPGEIRARPNLRVDPAQLVELSYREVVDLARDRVTREYLVQLLRACHGNVTRAAQRAAVERESLHRLMRRFHLRAEDFRERS